MNESLGVTRSQLEALLEELQGSKHKRSNSTGHTFYSLVPIIDNPKVDLSSFQEYGFSISEGPREEDINALLEDLGLESQRQGITLSVKKNQVIPEYQLRQMKEHFERAGYTLETVGLVQR